MRDNSKGIVEKAENDTMQTVHHCEFRVCKKTIIIQKKADDYAKVIPAGSDMLAHCFAHGPRQWFYVMTQNFTYQSRGLPSALYSYTIVSPVFGVSLISSILPFLYLGTKKNSTKNLKFTSLTNSLQPSSVIFCCAPLVSPSLPIISFVFFQILLFKMEKVIFQDQVKIAPYVNLSPDPSDSCSVQSPPPPSSLSVMDCYIHALCPVLADVSPAALRQCAENSFGYAFLPPVNG